MGHERLLKPSPKKLALNAIGRKLVLYRGNSWGDFHSVSLNSCGTCIHSSEVDDDRFFCKKIQSYLSTSRIFICAFHELDERFKPTYPSTKDLRVFAINDLIRRVVRPDIALVELNCCATCSNYDSSKEVCRLRKQRLWPVIFCSEWDKAMEKERSKIERMVYYLKEQIHWDNAGMGDVPAQPPLVPILQSEVDHV